MAHEKTFAVFLTALTEAQKDARKLAKHYEKSEEAGGYYARLDVLLANAKESADEAQQALVDFIFAVVA